MAVPLSYVVRNLAARRLTTLLTAGGMALVVYVFATVMMLAAGLERTLVATGSDDNVVVIRRGSQTEVQSGIDRTQAAIVESLPGIATGPDGRRLVSKEPVVLISLPKRESGKPSNVVIRGVTPEGYALRSQARARIQIARKKIRRTLRARGGSTRPTAQRAFKTGSR